MILQILRNLYFVSLCVIRLRFHELKSKLYKLEVRSSENGEVSRKMACDNNLKAIKAVILQDVHLTLG